MTTSSEPTTQVTRNPDLDLLHWRLERVTNANYGVMTVVLREKLGEQCPEIIDAMMALDESVGKAIQFLDTFIPGGCPNEGR